MCLQTCSERRQCKGDETTVVEFGGKTWPPGRKNEKKCVYINI